MRRELTKTFFLLRCCSLAACSAHGEPVAPGPVGPARVSELDSPSAPAAGPPEPAAPDVAVPAPGATNDASPRIGALGPHTWIYKVPAFRKPAVGKMRIGTSVRLRSPEPVRGESCPRGWYAVEPRGYVCLDATATLDLESPYFKALAFSAPDPGIWPYRYGHSDGAPMYSRVPNPSEWEDAERRFGAKGFKPLGAWAIGHEELIAAEPIVATDPVPWFLEGGKRRVPGGNFNPDVLVWKTIPAGSMLAYSRAFEMHGRVWLLTPDSMVVPADRISGQRRSTFKGVYFAESDLALPLAWNRSKGPLPKHRRLDDGSFVETAETVAAKTPVEIGDAEIERNGVVFYELRREPGTFVGKVSAPDKQLDAPLSVTRLARKAPRGVRPGEKWIEVKIVPGTLTAYDGDGKPVLATLFSPGKGGPPVPGNDHETYATTATGFFPVEWKERVATMSNESGDPKVMWFTDVPNQQYLRAPLAMHVSYWHEDFGKRKSAECVNVSPFDGHFLFGWTDPELPEGWNGVGPGAGSGRPTPIVVTVN